MIISKFFDKKRNIDTFDIRYRTHLCDCYHILIKHNNFVIWYKFWLWTIQIEINGTSWLKVLTISDKSKNIFQFESLISSIYIFAFVRLSKTYAWFTNSTFGLSIMTELKNIDIENEFLKGNTYFSGSLNLSDLWFLNGSDNKFSIMFFREELYEAFKIRIFRNSEEVVDTGDDSLPGSWDLMLIELFGSRFAITRIKNGFSKIYSIYSSWKRKRGRSW